MVLGVSLTDIDAGHNTIMITLVACWFAVSRHPTMTIVLRREIEDISLIKHSHYINTVTKNPLFLAVMIESMRTYSSAEVRDMYFLLGTTGVSHLSQSHLAF